MKRRDAAARPPSAGWRMPAEWEPHAATWLSWPHERSDWPGPGKLDAVRWVYAEFIRHLVRGERVRLIVPNGFVERRARRWLSLAGVDLSRVDVLLVPTDRSWARDYCPLFVRDGRGAIGLTTWRFTGWAKYPNHVRDAAMGDAVAKRQKTRPRWSPAVELDGRMTRIVLEGGAIDVNGRGTLLTTEECLASTDVQVRNPGLDRAALERVLGEHLGIRKVLWLGRGITGDDTHGHVDDCARFTDPHTVVACVTEDRSDPDWEPLRENLARLRRMTDQDGRPLRVVPLPMPAPVTFGGQRLPASYANFYVANSAVLMPTFNDEQDRRALQTLARLFPDRAVVGIHAVDLVLGLGTLHCMTMQEPA